MPISAPLKAEVGSLDEMLLRGHIGNCDSFMPSEIMKFLIETASATVFLDVALSALVSIENASLEEYISLFSNIYS